ncbi:RES family NAD+ phosphorylase [Coralloluteibacterium thermophilus]|uniref:RES family NAD+ phosphorylase n=1 Tax=Coralloluteibacterium thermophilum TaxID=2707049 RepID=A0ABV9NR99_9GAMM
MNRYLLEIAVPDDVFEARQVLPLASAPGGWDSVPSCLVSKDVGSQWYRSTSTAIFEVPSVVVPEESAVLINAVHPAMVSVSARVARKVDFRAIFRPDPLPVSAQRAWRLVPSPPWCCAPAHPPSSSSANTTATRTVA